MPNYCSNKMWFCSSDKEQLQKFFDIFRKCFDDIHKSSISELFVMHGYSRQEAEDITDRRDMIVSCSGIISKMKGSYFFEAETETAWAPHIECIIKLLREKYQDRIRVIYVSEECGSEIYVTNDFDGVFVTDRYKLDFCSDKRYYLEYFRTYDELICFIRRYLCEDVSELDSLSEMEDKITGCNGDDSCCTIARFEYDYDSERGAV